VKKMRLDEINPTAADIFSRGITLKESEMSGISENLHVYRKAMKGVDKFRRKVLGWWVLRNDDVFSIDELANYLCELKFCDTHKDAKIAVDAFLGKTLPYHAKRIDKEGDLRYLVNTLTFCPTGAGRVLLIADEYKEGYTF
jgi:hypothetical protein